MIVRGLTYWYFEMDRYFDTMFGDVKNMFAVQPLPKHEGALEPRHQLSYDALQVAGSCGEDKNGRATCQILEVNSDSE